MSTSCQPPCWPLSTWLRRLTFFVGAAVAAAGALDLLAFFVAMGPWSVVRVRYRAARIPSPRKGDVLRPPPDNGQRTTLKRDLRVVAAGLRLRVAEAVLGVGGRLGRRPGRG